MIVERLELCNWGPYRGLHELLLEDTVYAVVARDEAEPTRSNWIGKSWLLWAFRFALHGLSPPSARTEDDWITRGETEGSVSMTLSDGTSIVRSRRRGKSTQLSVTAPDNGGPATQAAGQERIDDLLAMSADDFGTSCAVQQKQIDKLVTMDPAPRTKLVGDWIGLGPLRLAEEIARSRLAAKLREDEQLAHSQRRLEEQVGSMRPQLELVARAEELRAGLKEKEERLVELEHQLEVLAEWRQHADNDARLNGVISEGQELKAKLEAEKPPSSERIGELESKLIPEAEVERRERAARVDEVARLVTGEFGGTCPVTRQDCPVADQVSERGKRMSAELEAAQGESGEALERVRVLRAEFAQLTTALGRRLEVERDLARLRERAKELLPSREFVKERGQPPSSEEARAELSTLRGSVSSAQAEISGFERDAAMVGGWARELAVARAERAELAKRIRTLREVVSILGRNGAQREVAVDELAEIEEGANALLVDADVDLRVSVSWGLEGKDPAKVCDSCGAAFPQSRKVKECGTCGAERGRHQIERLDLVPSSHSGAAEDLAGLAFQMSVAAWLRARRGTDWSTLLVDEAFAACDGANGRAIVTRLASLIRHRYSFRQALVVAHDAALMEALPARIQITRNASGELSIEVI